MANKTDLTQGMTPQPKLIVRVILEKYFGVTDFWVHVLTGVGTGLLAPLFFVSIMEKLNVRYVFYFPISKYLPGQST